MIAGSRRARSLPPDGFDTKQSQGQMVDMPTRHVLQSIGLPGSGEVRAESLKQVVWLVGGHMRPDDQYRRPQLPGPQDWPPMSKGYEQVHWKALPGLDVDYVAPPCALLD